MRPRRKALWKFAGLVLGAMLLFAQPSLAERKPGALFKDCSDCPEMVVIPAGTFSMGWRRVETNREGVQAKFVRQERPLHPVTIGRAFALGKFEVTRREFSIFVRQTGYSTAGDCYYWTGAKWADTDKKDWRDPGFPGYKQSWRDPVVCVNWKHARDYAAWLSKKTGKRYRLPSEAEWEYAARSGTVAVRFWGSSLTAACEYANINDSARLQSRKLRRTLFNSFPCRDGHVYTAPVGRFRPNAFGLHDMLGNVWEWVQDCWNPTYKGAPKDHKAWLAGNCKIRVLRGGSWFSGPPYVRSSFRDKHDDDGRMDVVGFRLARDLDPLR